MSKYAETEYTDTVVAIMHSNGVPANYQQHAFRHSEAASASPAPAHNPLPPRQLCRMLHIKNLTLSGGQVWIGMLAGMPVCRCHHGSRLAPREVPRQRQEELLCFCYPGVLQGQKNPLLFVLARRAKKWL